MRGTHEERKNKFKMPNFDKMTNSEILSFCQSGDSSTFIGYIIHSITRDDFLFKICEDSYTIRRQYTKLPRAALLFENYKKAESMLKIVPGDCVVGLLIDEPAQIKVCFLEKISR